VGAVTSPDGGGSADRSHKADGPAERDRPTASEDVPGGLPNDHDPVRESPPVDPWMTEAPTSVLGEATSLRSPDAAAGEVPLAETAPLTGTAPFDDAATPGDAARFDGGVSFDGPPSGWVDAPQPQRRHGRRAVRWVVAVLAACALFIAGMLAIDQFGSGAGNHALGSHPSTGATAGTTPGSAQDPTSTSAPSAGTAGNPAGGVPSGSTTAGGQPGATGGQPGSSNGAAVPGIGTDASAPVVVYRVTASGKGNTGSVSYTDQDGDIIRRRGIPLPWQTTFRLGPQVKALTLISQRGGGGDAGPVTCTITVAGKVLSSTTAYGPHAATECSGSGRSRP
jgi:hypothetical protein